MLSQNIREPITHRHGVTCQKKGHSTSVPTHSCKSHDSHIYWQEREVYITAFFDLSIMSSAENNKQQNSRKY